MDYTIDYQRPRTIDMMDTKNKINKQLWLNPRAPFRLPSGEYRDVTFKQFK